MNSQVCLGCGKAKELTDFNFKNKEEGIRHARCRACTRQQVNRHYENHRAYYIRKAKQRNKAVTNAHRAWVLQYLAKHPCVDCGETDSRCLDFDHVRGKKRLDVSRMIGNFSLEAIEEEIEKCEVRCSNCHRKRTVERRDRWKRLPALERP